MKKSLLALAVAAALPGVAFAQSSVTLGGVFKIGYASTKLSNGRTAVAGAPGDTFNNGSNVAMIDGSSKFVLSGVEDLGGGLKAIFQIDQRWRGDESPAASQASGSTWLGLAGGFGSIKLGKDDIYYVNGADLHAAKATPLQMWNVSILSYVNSNGTATATNIGAVAKASRTVNLLRYDSPAFGPVSFGLYYSTAGAGTGEGGATGLVGTPQKGQVAGGQLYYNSGPLNVGIALYDEKLEGYSLIAAGNATGSKAARIFGGYNFGMFSVSAVVDQSKITGSELKRTAFSLPLTANIGAGTVIFTWTQAQNVKQSGNTLADTGARMFSLGYDYALSKRTSLGVAYASLDNKNNANYQFFTNGAGVLGNTTAPTIGQDQKMLYVGIRHAF